MIITGKKFSKPAMSRVINGDTVLPTEEKTVEKIRLDHLLVEKHPEYNRSTLQKFIKDGLVTVDGAIVTKPNSKIEPTAKIVLQAPPEAEKSKIQLDIIYEDNHVKVVNKPSGLLSIGKGEIVSEPTLEDYGLLVHRLDRGTSGVVILAKDEKTQSFLRRQFQDRKAHKTYYAVVYGRPKQDTAKIDLPIARNLSTHTTFRVEPNGKPSITYYRVLKSNGDYSLLELKPITGRTHQLRVHLSYIGTPIVGDNIYGNKTKKPGKESADSRLLLHAYSLEITIPTEEGTPNERKTFIANLPEEFLKPFGLGQDFIQNLKEE